MHNKRSLLILPICIILLLITVIPIFAAQLEAQLILDINPGNSNGNPHRFVVFNGELFFEANDGTNGNEAWRYDGTVTEMITDFNPSGDGNALEATEYNNELYYRAYDGSDWNLVKYDGTNVTSVDTISPTGLEVYNGNLYFNLFASDGSQYQLYHYNGTSVTRDSNITPPFARQFDPREMTVYNGALYFTACGDEFGSEVWKYDGTDFTRISNINTGTASDAEPFASDANPSGYTLFNGNLYFSANDGTNGTELYEYDGTTISMVEDAIPGGGINPSGDAIDMEFSGVVYNGELYFAANDGSHGWELWKYDGSTASLVEDLKPGSDSSSPSSLVVYNGELYYSADDLNYSYSVIYCFDGSDVTKATDDSTSPFAINAQGAIVYDNLIVARAGYIDENDDYMGNELVAFNVAPASPDPGDGDVSLPQTGFAPGRITTLPVQTLEKAYKEMGELWIEIPALDLQTDIMGVPVGKDGWDLRWLTSQVGWLEGTAFPTWAGNSALTAHVYDSFGQPGPFVDLHSLKWGDDIIIHFYGQEYVYSVRDVQDYIDPGDTSEVFEHEEMPWLTLITCQGYEEKSDSYRWRIIVKAVQTSID